MFERIFFSLSMFVFKLFQGLSGVVVAAPPRADEPFYVNHLEDIQDFTDASRGLGYTESRD